MFCVKFRWFRSIKTPTTNYTRALVQARNQPGCIKKLSPLNTFPLRTAFKRRRIFPWSTLETAKVHREEIILECDRKERQATTICSNNNNNRKNSKRKPGMTVLVFVILCLVLLPGQQQSPFGTVTAETVRPGPV